MVLRQTGNVQPAPSAPPLSDGKALQTPADSGDLVIVDHFQPTSPDSAPHGQVIHTTVQDEGFSGKVLERFELPATLRPEDAKGDTSDQFCSSLERKVSSWQSQVLNNEAGELRTLAASGLHDGAVNFSSGCSQARVVWGLYTTALHEPTSDTPEQQADHARLMDQYSKAFHFDPTKLVGADNDASHARGLFLQGLCDLVKQGEADPDFMAAKVNYDKAVADISKKSVSVVVAAENSGSDLAQYSEASGGQKLNLAPDFFKNPLASADTVTVGSVGGADRSAKAPESISDFNSPERDDILANGVTTDPISGDDDEGTSFAAPRVAAALAKVHSDHPGMADRDALGYLLANDTHPLNGDASKAVLDADKTAQLLGGPQTG